MKNGRIKVHTKMGGGMNNYMGGDMIRARVGRSIERKKSNLVKETPIKNFIKNTLEGKYVDRLKGTAEPLDILQKSKIRRKKGGLLNAKKGKLVGKQKNLPLHLQKKILA
jgi:hypothetical protein